MAFATNKPMDILFQEIADDLVKYSNAFLLKSRVDNIPGVNAKPVFSEKIVGGYFRIDPASIRIKRDKHGNVLRYEQGYGENTKSFAKEDVIHMFMDKDANNAFGTPRIIAALEDIKLLRKIEGNVVALIYRFSMPIYQWMVGLPQQGFQGTDIEIEKAQREIESSTLDGVIVTNERTAIKTIGAEGSALDASGYLKYFEERAFTALSMSASQMGRGGAKQDSESMEAQTHDTVKYIQRVLSTFIEFGMIGELLLEGGFDPIRNTDDSVQYKFEEISLETKIKKENHEMLKYQSNGVTFEEYRRRTGMKDSVDNEERLYKNMIENKSALEQIDRTAEHQKEMAKINAQNKPSSDKKSSNSSVSDKKSRASKSQSPNKDATNKNRPTNQHGTGSVKIRELLDMKESHSINASKYKKQFKIMDDLYSDMLREVLIGTDIDVLIDLMKDVMVDSMVKYLDNYTMMGITNACNEINAVYKEYNLLPNDVRLEDSFVEEFRYSIVDILNNIKGLLNKQESDANIVFESNEYKVKYIVDYLCRKAYWYSYIKTGASLNKEEAYIIFNSSKDAEGKEEVVNTNKFTLEDIPGYHSFCRCEITYDKKNLSKNKTGEVK